MELKEYLNIIKKHFGILILITVLILVGVASFFLLKPQEYQASLTLNISREGARETQDYQFDDFYRLQADEKFADTLVEWLKNPRVVSDIYQKAGIDTQTFSLKSLSRSFSPAKYSSQTVVVNFSSATHEQAQKLSDSIILIIQENTEKLNEKQQEKTWFQVIAFEPLVKKEVFNWLVIILAGILLGIFFAFWVVLFIHYLK